MTSAFNNVFWITLSLSLFSGMHIAGECVQHQFPGLHSQGGGDEADVS